MHEVPELFTPINSVEILRQKRLTIVVQVYEKTKTKCDNFAYININLKDFQPVERTQGHTTSWDYELLIHELPVIGSNCVLGKFQAVMNFRIVNRQVPPEQPPQDFFQQMQEESKDGQSALV